MNKLFVVLLVIVFAVIISCDTTVKNKKVTVVNRADSITIYADLLLEDSLNPELYSSRAELYFELGKIDPALRDLQMALKLAPDNPKLYLLLSDIYIILGQTDNGIAALKKSIRLNPNSEIPFLKLSETYLLLNDPNTSIRYADEAIKINIKNPESYYIKAMGLLENNDTSDAIINLGISANLDSNNFMANMQLGAIYTAKRDSISEKYFKNALIAKPDDERALYYLGMYYQEQKEFDKAISNFSRITEIYPSNKRVYYNMGYIYLVEKEDFENAKIMFQEAISISPGFVEAVYNLGRTMEALGDYEGARKQYVEALEILPNYPLAVQGMNRLDDMLIKNQ